MYDYPKVCSDLLDDLPGRTKDVILRRFGLKEANEPETLESIGESYQITRERVRQIEKEGLKK
ncbi:MAG: sigma factor-like helix-turn-helix DNA-binding protein, partial [Patescibacteria group bacterium]